MVLISPVQGNEEGFKRAKENEGVWELSGVNNEKELSRSMDVLLGIFDQNNTRTKNGIEHQMVISSPKARDVGFKPFPVSMSGCGWFTILGAATSSKINIGDGPAPDTLEDIPVL